jgi:NAD(P)-dependent dehydrogenase (short-subunit alcohol dehydrogenase family)
MSDRVVLVTGALAGIGRETATAFGREGSAVVVSGQRDEESVGRFVPPGATVEIIRTAAYFRNHHQAGPFVVIAVSGAGSRSAAR